MQISVYLISIKNIDTDWIYRSFIKENKEK